MGALEGIEHVVVLMLENRSFDCMLGALYPADATFAGLTGEESNLDGTTSVPVWNDEGMDARNACIPTPDPGEIFTDMNVQLFGGSGVRTADPPPMSGFVQNYVAQPVTNPPRDPKAVMHYFTPKQVPVISALAKAFGVCDQWHASAPCQTWPNRFFVHTGTALGCTDNSKFHIPFDAPSIFRQLEDNKNSWRVYFHDMPQSILIRDIWDIAPLHFHHLDQFLIDVQGEGTLPNYSFIEPRYFTDTVLGKIPNDEHPPHNVVYGEQLIASVYNAVRSSPNWKNTLLVITYDEHGGCYDHVSPPQAAPPDTMKQYGFSFDTYGVRVPAVLISPYMPPGSIVRVAPSGPPHPFDHTSIIATLRKLFDLGDPLTSRDAVAPDLLDALSLDEPTNDGPARIDADTAEPTDEELQAHADAPPNDMQKALCHSAALLPLSPLASADLVPAASQLPTLVFDSVAAGLEHVTQRIGSFLGRR